MGRGEFNEAAGHGPAALGLSVHTGWAHAVAVAVHNDTPSVVYKERMALWEPSQRGAAHFYHRAAQLPLAAVGPALAEDELESRRVTAQSLQHVTGELGRLGYRLVAARVVDRPRRPLPPLEKVLTSHPLLHAAEGALFRDIVLSEAAKVIADATEIDAAVLLEGVARAAALSPTVVAERLARAGKIAGSPWSREHQQCALAAWFALAAHDGQS
ncbi:MAG: hypothetical protein HY342_07215 [Candidatus Lambdaproteobacteria bacterium]|nr:hypothetical protein [Candidatus Lambdaproteobacteria bacterium]